MTAFKGQLGFDDIVEGTTWAGVNHAAQYPEIK
jgi:hypothetical protein